ncbi:MAG: hypothetical protein C0595_13805 [Marinilabiliales bacterium]|nr:MAG: hypothetical protein C0595_13805 [Marinilabiliales bacterium]
MKITINKLGVLLAVVFLFTACKKEFLDRPPLDTDVSTNFYKTEQDAMLALISVYDVLGYQSTPGVSWAPFLTMSDILSDDSFAGGGDANDGKNEDEFNNFDIPTSSLIAHSIWLKNYTGIYRANLLLEKIGDIEASEEFKTRIIGECKFMRAYFYLEQVRFFENIPLLTETIKGPSEYIQPQATPEAVYNQIATDLVDAYNVLPANIPSNETGRISKWAASGLLARTYLFYNGVYNADLNANGTVINQASILAYLEDMISNSGHDLFEDYSQNFSLTGEFGIESVFEISHGDILPWWDWNYVRGGDGNLAAQMQGPRVTGSDNWDRGWSFGTVNQKLVDDMGSDPRLEYTVLFEEELDGSLNKGYQHTGYFSKKYSSDAEHWATGGQFELNRTCNFRVLRYSDVLLMAAELGSPNAQQYLDKVRARVGLESIPATPENIYNERRLELSLEGIRYFDVLRKGQSFAEQELTVVGVRGPKYVGDQVLFDVSYNSATKGFLPIPQSEVDLMGDSFTQNTGY